MTTMNLERSMLRQLKDGQTIDPRLLAGLDDGGPVGAGSEHVPAATTTSAARGKRRASASR